MFNIKIADIVIGIENKYEYIREMCRDYITEEAAEFCISVTDEEIMREDEVEKTGFPAFYLETLAIYRKIADRMPEYGGFLMHGVLMSAEDRGILLTAESGTGKSTHAALWMQLPGVRCEIINGDKPLLRIIDGCVYAYGTPWCGKEGIHKNARVVLTDICFLERGKENSICNVDKGEIMQNLLPSIHIPQGDGVIAMLDAIDTMARLVNFRRIKCNMDISAAETAYNEIIKK
ncbi:MAG: hypothetical protein IJN09_03495 [Oscillospiraceae bacterium]|nr:hypothetical protein [Oscillospiraceae bacterium]